MKTMAITKYGPVTQLQLTDLPEPPTISQHVKIKVIGSAVNPADPKVLTGEVKMLHGRKFPLVVGYDFAGEVEAVGQGVTEFKTGQRVFGFLPYSPRNNQGAFAEKIVVPQANLAVLPEAISFENGGTCATAAITALQALRTIIGKTPQASVLINGASGGVGVYAVQIAKLMGAKVTATCSAASAAFVKSLGADECVDYRNTHVTGLKTKFDGIFDVASNLSFFEVRHAILKGGRFVSLLPSASVFGGIMAGPFLSQKCSMILVKPVKADLELIAQWVSAQKLTTPIDKTFNVKDVAEAIACLEKGGVRGKIAVNVRHF